jgi:hypothetical protein
LKGVEGRLPEDLVGGGEQWRELSYQRMDTTSEEGSGAPTHHIDRLRETSKSQILVLADQDVQPGDESQCIGIVVYLRQAVLGHRLLLVPSNAVSVEYMGNEVSATHTFHSSNAILTFRAGIFCWLRSWFVKSISALQISICRSEPYEVSFDRRRTRGRTYSRTEDVGFVRYLGIMSEHGADYQL